MFKRKSLNKSYNKCYNRKKTIRMSSHAAVRMNFWGLEPEWIEETIRTGRLSNKKSVMGRKCLYKYIGKENITCFIVVKFNKYEIEVITAWPKVGK